MSPLACRHSSKTLIIKKCIHLLIISSAPSTVLTYDEIPCCCLTCISLAALHWPLLCGSRPAGPSQWLLDCVGHCAASATPHPPAHFCVDQQQERRPPPLQHPQLKMKKKKNDATTCGLRSFFGNTQNSPYSHYYIFTILQGLYRGVILLMCWHDVKSNIPSASSPCCSTLCRSSCSFCNCLMRLSNKLSLFSAVCWPSTCSTNSPSPKQHKSRSWVKHLQIHLLVCQSVQTP